jgi:Acyl carrier protein
LIYQKVAEILADILNLDEEDVSPNMGLTSEFEVEKIQIAKLVIECEKKFKITIHDEKVNTFLKLNDIVKYIENMLEDEDGNISESSDEERMWWYYL